ncbi:MAG: hypothetical protein GJ680_15435 [Alteromonadaceae bacterium]|nr:hypothetical protein [Alteromonadaceae bacterium]
MSSAPAPLREDVKVRKLVQQGQVSYVLKEPDKQEYYRFTVPQYQLIRLFDGIHDLTAIVNKFNETSDEYEYDVDAAQAVFNACRDYQVLQRTKQEENVALLERIREERKKSLIQAKGSVLMMRFKLVDPNKWFDHIIDSIRFVWSPRAIKFQTMFILFAFFLIAWNGQRFAQDFTQVYLQTQLSGVIYIWIIALVAIALHECGHGLTCKYYGGDVHEMGFLLLAFQPCLYCNVNDAWLFENKNHKIQVALAGVWVELLVAALATLVWLAVDVHNPVGYIAFVLMTIGTASSLLVNLNPLLKFDGYYILTDWLEMQNLRQNSLAWFSWNLKTKLFGAEDEKPFEPSEREKRVYWIYGTAVAVYMTLFLSFIGWLGYQFVYAQFGFLAIIGFLYVVFIFVRSITGNWISTLLNWFKTRLWSTKATKIRTGVISLFATAVMVFWQPKLTLVAEGTVESTSHVLYSPANAFVESVAYDTDRKISVDSVNSVFLQMHSPELIMQISDLQASQQALEGRKVSAILEDESAEVARTSIELNLIKEQLDNALAKAALLKLTLPEGFWSVDGLPPDLLKGRFFSEQQEVLTLISEQERFFDAIVDQRDVAYLSVGDNALVRLNAGMSNVYDAEVISKSAIAMSSGVEQKVLVRLLLKGWQDDPYLPVGLGGEAKLYGETLPLWQHLTFKLRKFFRADLWL